MKKQPVSSRKPAIIALVGVIALGAIVVFGGNSSDSPSSAIMPVGPDGYGRDSIGTSGGSLTDGDAGQGLSYDEKAAANSIAPSIPALSSEQRSAAAPDAVSNPGSPESGSPALIDDRKIVQTASMRLEVEEVGAGFEEVGRIATASGGFVASSSFSNQGDAQVASVTVRVPAGRYQQVLADFRELGVKVIAEDSKSSDVTAEYTDLGSRLRNLEAAETQLLVLLERATSISEILQVQDRLNNVRSEIEQVKGRMAMLDKLTDLATITVHLQPVAVANGGSSDGGRLGNEISAAWDDSIEFLTDIAAGAIHIVVFAWWVPFVAIPVVIIGGRYFRSRPRPVEAAD